MFDMGFNGPRPYGEFGPGPYGGFGPGPEFDYFDREFDPEFDPEFDRFNGPGYSRDGEFS